MEWSVILKGRSLRMELHRYVKKFPYFVLINRDPSLESKSIEVGPRYRMLLMADLWQPGWYPVLAFVETIPAG